jgi:glycosyltransferase involved in cell wall biosynthesis
MRSIAPGLVEVLVSDNCSPDETPAVVEGAIKAGLPIQYIRNETNLGWALNFAQAYERARGKYILLMGDDDFLFDGALSLIVNLLTRDDYGVVVVRPYGFDEDFRKEHPGGSGRQRVFLDANAFLIAVSRYFTLTSACIVNKSLLSGVDSRRFIDTDLAAFHFVLRAALAAERNLFIESYQIASKRQNSFAYEYTDVFVDQMWRILDSHVPFGLKTETIRTIERHKMISYYPFYLFDLRTSGRGNLKVTWEHFDRRFHGRWLFRVWLEPTIRLPRPLAIVWGAGTTFLGRVASRGQLRRGVMFAANRMSRMIARKRSGPNDLREVQGR